MAAFIAMRPGLHVDRIILELSTPQVRDAAHTAPGVLHIRSRDRRYGTQRTRQRAAHYSVCVDSQLFAPNPDFELLAFGIWLISARPGCRYRSRNSDAMSNAFQKKIEAQQKSKR